MTGVEVVEACLQAGKDAQSVRVITHYGTYRLTPYLIFRYLRAVGGQPKVVLSLDPKKGRESAWLTASSAENLSRNTTR